MALKSRGVTMNHTYSKNKTNLISLIFAYLVIAALCIVLVACDINIGIGGTTGSGSSCQSNCITGSGVHGVRVFVEPNAGESPITNAIRGAQKSVWLEIYLLTDRNV